MGGENLYFYNLHDARYRIEVRITIKNQHPYVYKDLAL